MGSECIIVQFCAALRTASAVGFQCGLQREISIVWLHCGTPVCCFNVGLQSQMQCGVLPCGFQWGGPVVGLEGISSVRMSRVSGLDWGF